MHYAKRCCSTILSYSHLKKMNIVSEQELLQNPENVPFKTFACLGAIFIAFLKAAMA